MPNPFVSRKVPVGYNSDKNMATRLAYVVDAPTILPGGRKNFDENNIPEAVDLLVLQPQGLPQNIYRVRHKSFGDPAYWVELDEMPEWTRIGE